MGRFHHFDALPDSFHPCDFDFPHRQPNLHGTFDQSRFWVSRFSLTGHVVDRVTSLSYMQQRYYDPVAGHFLSVDPVAADVGSFNRYSYANNNPYKYIDPDGRKISVPNPADRVLVKNLINNKALGAFGIRSDGTLFQKSQGGDSSKYSKTYSAALNAGIASDKSITISVSDSYQGLDMNDQGGVTDARSGDGNSAVIISGKPNSIDGLGEVSAANVLVHEIVGHAVPNALNGAPGNAVANENIVRAEVGDPMRPPDPEPTRNRRE